MAVVLSSRWATYEIAWRDANDETVTPFSDTLGRSGAMARQAVTKMRIVQDTGWPQALHQLKDQYGKPWIVRKDDVIWLLKCKPSCWRLYFYVNKTSKEKRLIYVHAVCKKKDRENPSDASAARRLADQIRSGASAITPFEFPTG